MSEATPTKGGRKPRNWRETALRPEPYDPLTLENLGRSIEMRMLEMEPAPLTDVPLMIGAGIYALYYVGSHELYTPIAEPYCQTPIYVGKATPEGGRKGGEAGAPDEEDALWDRLRDHRRSIEQARDLDVADFRVRYLVAVDFFVSLAEQLMLRQFKPVWNTIVDGFGNHAPGSGRTSQARPPWDDLHPGRSWSTPERMPKPSQYTAAESEIRILNHWEQSGRLPAVTPLLPE
ncbi:MULTISPECIES: Eco29kI family restriction endonuclease [unclassified Streptomyces]|uniref:Eco29kI family restriction endonuclease n=1 Tax=unclassified Streptomyces TaxID=2593676 RepID=UPI000DB992B5|nr:MULTISPECIES: Eco29kI family restriction endonuclease [unclassified Streptomyces]MYT71368.1 Eco29kI family restriction endonuclease [Streptomyces sp. SID8367]RAJ82826.1 Eco29kI restriction endonuclease [Streptomyces sp. PsTaAH-137]